MSFSSFKKLLNQAIGHVTSQANEFFSVFTKQEKRGLGTNEENPGLFTLPENQGLVVQKTNKGFPTQQQKLVILCASGILVGFLSVFLISSILEWRQAKVKVLVAKQEVYSWTALREPAKLFEEEARKESEVPGDHVASFEELANKVLVRDLKAGEVLCKSALMASNKLGVEGRLKEGMRAVAVETDAAIAAGGFVHPDSFVDVIHTHLDEHQQLVSTVILQDIHVLAEDQKTGAPQDKPGSVPRTVTLEVDPYQALKLSEAKEAGGALALLLRPFGDHEIRQQRTIYGTNKDGSVIAFSAGSGAGLSGSKNKRRLDTSVYDPEDVAPDPDVVAGLKSPPSPDRSKK